MTARLPGDRRLVTRGLKHRERPVLAGTVTVVAVLALVPVGYLLWGAFFNDRGPTLAYFRDAYSTYGLGSVAANSLLFAVGSMALAVGLGGSLAFLAVRTDVPLRRTMFVLAVVPLAVPNVLYTFAWILVGSPRAGLLSGLSGPAHVDVFSLGGMMLVEGMHLAPIPLLMVAAALRSMDPALEEAAIASGAGTAVVLRRVTARLVAPAIYSCMLLTTIGALESFEVPVLLGIPAGIWMLNSRVWSAFNQFPPALGQAGAYSCSLLALTVAGAFLYGRLTRRGRRFETVVGGRFRPHRFALGRWRLPAAVAALACVTVATIIPLGMLVYCSLQPVYTRPSLAGLSTLTLSHYRDAVGTDSLRAFEHSLLLSVGAATIVMLMMAVVAWIVIRTRVRGRWLLDALASVPIVVPGLVVGVALLLVYLHSPVVLYGTPWILLIAYVTRFMPHGMRFAAAAIRQLAGELEDASHASGAAWSQTFRRIVLPLVAPGLAAGWTIVFILSLLELSSSIVLYPPGTEVISVRIWQQLQEGQLAAPAATGVLLLLLLGSFVAAVWWLGGRTRFRQILTG